MRIYRRSLHCICIHVRSFLHFSVRIHVSRHIHACLVMSHLDPVSSITHDLVALVCCRSTALHRSSHPSTAPNPSRRLRRYHPIHLPLPVPMHARLRALRSPVSSPGSVAVDTDFAPMSKEEITLTSQASPRLMSRLVYPHALSPVASIFTLTGRLRTRSGRCSVSVRVLPRPSRLLPPTFTDRPSFKDTAPTSPSRDSALPRLCLPSSLIDTASPG